MEKISKRIAWIDIFKGVVLIWVILGHLNGRFVKYAYLFHMPAFFFISGMTFNQNIGFYKLISTKFLRIMLPVFAMNILFLTMQLVLTLMGKGEVLYSIGMSFRQYVNSIVNLFIKFIGVDLAGVSWFFVCLFYVILFSWFLIKLCNKIIKEEYSSKILLAISAIVYLFGYYAANHMARCNIIPFDLVFITQLYFVLGFELKEKMKSIEIGFKHRNKIIVLLSVSMFFSYYFANINWAGFDLSMRQLGNPIMNLASASNGIFLCIVISMLFSKLNFVNRNFSYVGKRTMSFAMFHFLGFRVAFYILHKLGYVSSLELRNLIPMESINYWPFITVFTLLFCYLMDRIFSSNEYSKKIFLGE